MTGLKRTLVAAGVSAAMVAAPALADTPGTQHAHGKATAPGQLCKNESKKKTMHGKGQSPFAACVVGVKRAQAEIAAQQDKPAEEQTHTSPAKLCKDRSRKKAATDRKSPYAACVSGAAKAQNDDDQAGS